MTAIDEEIEKHKERLIKLETLRAALADPELAEIARRELGVTPAIEPRVVAVRTPTELSENGSFAAIRDLLLSRGNQPVTFEEVAKACGLAASTVKKIVYTKFPFAFEKLGMQPGEKVSRFRLAVEEE